MLRSYVSVQGLPRVRRVCVEPDVHQVNQCLESTFSRPLTLTNDEVGLRLCAKLREVVAQEM